LQFVDSSVSRSKFARELTQYKKFEHEYLRRGWWMLSSEFPEVFIVFGTPNLKPPAVAFGALLDFTNYDYWAPSVRLVDPFTRIPYLGKELPTILKRRTKFSGQLPPGLAAQLPPQIAAQNEMFAEQPLMIFHNPDDVPFLCMPGVREYHDHPAHSGDSWLLHRGKGEGTLHHILDTLFKYGVQPLSGYQLGLSVSGLTQKVAPS